ncbi:hypothetical protein DV515_00017092 [Chloebia gouldiae]|uniref:WD repeat-containing protein 54 beta-propeller domain-containing protein n=1 Tax=Chloebia gouldiae TaxID=44316 RepID=A0A3L8R9N5_CHLGU|nr:hypothetical protein DV515_00017092 [Chloebia gouldiae]
MAAASTGPYRRERSLALRGSSSALYNNLAVLRPPGRAPAFGAVHGSTLSLLGTEGHPRQLQARGGGSALSTPLLTQAAWCELPSRVLLVLTSQRGVQPIPCSPEASPRPAAASSAWDGAGDLVTADDSGTLCLWSSGEEFTLLGKIPGSGCTCSSVALWNGVVAAGYGNGQIRLWEAGSGQIRAQVSAHARWIYALDLAPLTGKLLSGAEDSFVHVWKLCREPDSDDIEVQHCHAECVTDTQVCGARFCDPAGDTFAVTGYDLSEILCYGPA